MKASNFLKLFLALLVGMLLVGCNSPENADGNITVSLKVDCSEVLDNLEDEEYAISDDKLDIVPKDGVILEVDASCSDADNAFKLLTDSLKGKKIHFEDEDGYIIGIANIYAGDCGDNSGWMFFINGELAEKGATETALSDGDYVEFRYVVDYMTLFE